MAIMQKKRVLVTKLSKVSSRQTFVAVNQFKEILSGS